MMNQVAAPIADWLRPIYGIFRSPDSAPIRVRADSYAELLVAAAEELFRQAISNLDDVRPTYTEHIIISGDCREAILLDWLNELLLLYRQRQLIFSQFEVIEVEGGIQASAIGEPLDFDRHIIEHEIQGIDANSLFLEQRDLRWLADVQLEV